MLNEQSKPYILFHYFNDLMLIAFSWFLATAIRFLLLADSYKEFLHFLKLMPVPVIVAAYFLYRERYYTMQTMRAWHLEFSRLLMLNLKIQIFFILAGYNIQSERISRLTLILFFLICQVLLTANRIVFRNHLIMNRIKGKRQQKIFIVGQGDQVERFVSKVLSTPLLGVSILGWADSDGLADKMGIPSYSEEEADAVLKDLKPHNIILGYSGKKSGKQDKFIRTHYNQVTPIILIPQLNYSLIGAYIEDFQGLPLININKPAQHHISLMSKRLLDIFGAGMGLLVLSPFLFIIGLLVKITSPGPVFYGQERMTVDGKVFKMWKFRSMKVNADQEEGFTWTVENDPRRTRFGTFLRTTSIDEFPQLWNVLKGDMSLVGPRPERPELIDGFKDEIPGYMLRHKMKAGITGWAQINGWRGNTSLEKRIQFDIYYIRNWSLTLDLKILILTVVNGFINKNAY